MAKTITRTLGVRAWVYITAVMLGGLAGATQLLLNAEFSTTDLVPTVLFSLFAVTASMVSIARRGSTLTRITHQTGSSFTYPLLLLVDPGLVCIALCVTTLADSLLNRRPRLNSAFNVGQLLLAAWVAVSAVRWVRPDFAGLEPTFVPSTLLASAAVVLLYALINHGLTLGVLRQVDRRFKIWTRFNRMGLLNEAFCIVSGLAMAVLWQVDPWLTTLGVIPIFSMTFIIATLNRREQALENREVELRSLQGLGLEIGSVLEPERLYDALLRIASDTLDASKSMLAFADAEDDERLDVKAHRGIAPEPPAVLPAGELGASFWSDGRTLRVCGAQAMREFAAFDCLQAKGMLLTPLEVHGKRNALLILGHGENRRPFDDRDQRRLESLVPFINVALSNSKLVSELKSMQSFLFQQEKMIGLGKLVSGVAHELNNPLTSVLGYGELLASRELDPRKRDMLHRIRAEAKRAAKIVEKLLKYSRKHKPEKSLLDINTVLAKILELRAHALHVSNIEISRSLARDLPKVFVDAHQFGQVFLNLLINAEQAINNSPNPARLTVESFEQDGNVCVTLGDTGQGIKAEDLKHVFVPFFSTKETGTGLGLSICYLIIKDHSGSIDVQSEPGKGTTFVIRLPPANAAGAEQPAPAKIVSRERFKNFRGRMLVVDDEESITQLVAEYFGAEGWTVLSAREGSQALELVERLKFDVLLVDLKMPGMDGETFFERLRREHAHLIPRVIFVTGDTDSATSRRFLEGLDNPVLNKPYDLDQLARYIFRRVERVDDASPSIGSVDRAS